MPILSTAFKHRSIAIGMGINFLLAGILWTMPLTSDLDYEFAELYGIVCFWTGVVFSWRHVRHPIGQLSPFTLGLTTVSIVLLGTCLQWVTCGCSPERGIFFFFLLPYPMVLSGTAIGLFCVRRTNAGLWLIGVVVVSLAGIALDLAMQVPIFVHSWIWGYFHGPIWDEWVPMTWTLGLHQLGTVVFAVAVSALSRFPKFTSWQTLLVLVVLATLWLGGNVTGSRVSYPQLNEALPIERHSGSISLRLDASLDSLAQRILNEATFAYERVKKQLDISAGPRVTIFVFKDAEQKKKIFGAGETNFAKPWRNEIFVNAADAEGVIRHEMVHIVASQNGWPVWRSGLLEGLAVAVDWDEPYFTPHEWAAALLQLDRLPPVEDWFAGPGFFSQSSRMSYILAGSFVRFLIDTYGVDKINLVYGGQSFENVYGVSLPDLDALWRHFLADRKLSREDIDWAQVLLQKSLFGKRCVHAIADHEWEAARNVDELDWKDASVSYRRALELDSDRTDIATQLVATLAAMHDLPGAESIASDLLRKPLVPSRRAQLLLLRGDILVQQDLSDSATASWTRCLTDYGLIPSVYIASHLRLSASTSRAHWTDLKRLLAVVESEEKISILQRIVKRSPDLKLPRFWMGLILFGSGKPDAAVDVLADSGMAFQDSVFEYRRRVVIIESLLQTDQLDAVAPWFSGTESLSEREIDRNHVKELRAYWEWLKRRRE